MTPIRVLIVDDHDIFRRGLRAVLEQHRAVAVVGEASDLEGIRLARLLRPDVVLMDVQMPRLDGVTATRLIRQELAATRVIILSMHQEDQYVLDGVRAGASGYILKEDPAQAVLDAILAAASGQALLSAPVTAKILQQFTKQVPSSGAPREMETLTDREREILQLVAQGYRNTQIALLLSISPSTIKAHLRSIFRKLRVRSRVEAALLLSPEGRADTSAPSPADGENARPRGPLPPSGNSLPSR